jgi:hypothetical protein
MGASVEHLTPEDFETAKPLRADPGLLAALACGALSCIAIGALVGAYFGANSVSLF